MAAYYGYISADQFTFRESIWYIGYIIVGGMGTIAGTFFGVIFLKFLEFIVTGLAPDLSMLFPALGSQLISGLMVLVFSVVVILFLIFEPRGLYHRWELAKNIIRLWPFTY